MEKPKYEQLRGLSPTIAIEQKSASSNPRSTVGTVTEIYDYLRVLYARAGEQRCHLCGGEVSARSAAEIVDELLTLPAKTRATLMARKSENRKGEFREVFEEARKAGFSRVRINGLIQRLEDVTALDKKKKHTIEIVIDRVSIDPADRARLTDSVETAVKVGGGSVLVAVEGEPRERAYSEARACPDCGVGLPELSPQSFSFNSPLGMCVDCNGLGSSMEIDADLIVPDPSKSISEGAIEPWGERAGKESGWTGNVAAAVSREFGIPLDKPWKSLTPRQREVLLFGAGDKRVKVSWAGKHGTGSWAMRFSGVVNTIKKRMQESTSEVTRQWYGRYFREQLCRACGGQRLRPESRAVVLASKSIVDVTGMTVAGAAQHFTGLGLKGARAQIATEILKEVNARLGLPAGRRARVPDAGPRGGDAVGRRGAAHPAGVAAGLGAVGRHVRAGRAVDRPAPARQPAPHLDAAAAARPRQQRDRRRARRRDHRGRRPRRRLRPRRRPPGRPRHRRGHARRAEAQPELASPAASCRAPSGSRSRPSAASRRGSSP